MNIPTFFLDLFFLAIVVFVIILFVKPDFSFITGALIPIGIALFLIVLLFVLSIVWKD